MIAYGESAVGRSRLLLAGYTVIEFADSARRCRVRNSFRGVGVVE
jgi:hypothetical protein